MDQPEHLLVAIEGPDGLGKSTQIKKLQNHFRATVLQQPSALNSVGFLRRVVKEDPTLKPFERQCLHTISHIVDFFTTFPQGDMVIMDRCHLSTFIYGKLQMIPNDWLGWLMKIHATTFLQAAGFRYQPVIVVLMADKPFVAPDRDAFERTLNWNKLKDEYESFLSDEDRPVLFNNRELIYGLDITERNEDEIFESILDCFTEVKQLI